MKIAAIRERTKGETRIAITPDVVSLFVKKGFSVFVEKDIGVHAHFSNEEYEKAGAKVSAVPLEVLSDADIILKVQASPLDDKVNEIEMAKEGACIVGMISPYNNEDYINKASGKKLSLVAMEFVPRTTKAQSMDVLSSQANLAGYRAVLEAAYHFDKGFPMLMTSAGTIHPAKVLILGAGVAGLQAIATAKRLGASVSAYDVRSATKEQVESLGGKFIYPQDKLNDSEEKSGYAKEVSKDFAEIQKKFLFENAPKFDIIITTAQIPGKKAPLLIDKATLEQMKSGTVIVDMAASTGGNVSESELNKVVERHGVKIIGWGNLATKIASDASRLYAKNLFNFLTHAIKEDQINFKDELVEEMLVCEQGQIINKKFKV